MQAGFRRFVNRLRNRPFFKKRNNMIFFHNEKRSLMKKVEVLRLPFTTEEICEKLSGQGRYWSKTCPKACWKLYKRGYKKKITH